MNNILLQLKVDNNTKYQVNNIWNNAVYTKKSIISYLPKFYYLML